jgi:hypothetical protein
MKQNYKKLSIMFNGIITESKVYLLLSDMVNAPNVKKVLKINYTSSGAEAVVLYGDGKKYKVIVEPIQ